MRISWQCPQCKEEQWIDCFHENFTLDMTVYLECSDCQHDPALIVLETRSVYEKETQTK